ncbi:MAG: hypothetical protein AB7E32_16825, partial [Desulfovibrio sp.]
VALCLVLMECILSFAPRVPSLSVCIEFAIVVLIVALAFSALRSSRLSTNLFAMISLLIGIYYTFAVIYMYLESEDFVYLAFIFGLLQIILGILIVTNRFANRPSSSIKYTYSLIPIGYLALLAVHKPRPIEANHTMFVVQLITIFLLILPSSPPSKRYSRVCKALILFIATFFILYAVIAVFAGGYFYAVGYSIYGLVIAWLGLKVSPYAHLPTVNRVS